MLTNLLRLIFLHLLAWAGRLFVARPAPDAAPRRILVIKPDHLGDVLLATPALQQLRQNHPQAQIVALVNPSSAVILQSNPDLDGLLTLPFPGFVRQPMPPAHPQHVIPGLRLLAPYVMLFRYAALVRAGNFDTALLFRDDHWWGAALALLAGIPKRIGHAVPVCRPFLTTALDWNPQQHVAAQELAVAAAADEKRQAAYLQSLHIFSLRFDPAPADVAWATDWLVQQGVRPDERLVVIHPGTGGPTKHWRAERWAAVATMLTAQSDIRIALTGGPAEEALVSAVTAAMQRATLTLAGQTSIGQLAALLGRAALVLGVDSGPLHLAVSQSVPTIHLFGPSDQKRFGPWGDPARHRVVRAGLWCSPCGVFSACPRHTDPPECMEAIAVDDVIRAARSLLA
ncbi:MAG: glycosyltransferase family 9 protein [Chloroflexales bacterium]|nr:glycosyltransferase family 9 protein [Chloroflexales bacterium]